MSMTLFGMRVAVATEHPRYTLPEEVLPGVPWPPGFRDEINDWAREACGTWCAVRPGTVVVSGNVALLHPDTYRELRTEADEWLR